jgi:SAM-dependent methyltransferase
VYLSPRPAPEAANYIYPKDYYTVAGKHTAKASLLIAAMKKHVIRRRLGYVKRLLPENPRIIEVGCGDCQLLIDLKRIFPKAELVGVDMFLPDEMKKNAHAMGLKLIEKPIEDVVLAQGYFDLVIMNQLIEHLWDVDGTMAKLYDSLKTGGVVSIETPNVGSYERAFFPEGTWGGYYTPRHFNLFGFATMRRLLEKHGFKVVRQENLLAVVVWAFGFKSLCSINKRLQEFSVGRFFSDTNPACLGLFTCVDLIAKAMGLTTSNQKAIAVKRGHSRI